MTYGPNCTPCMIWRQTPAFGCYTTSMKSYRSQDQFIVVLEKGESLSASLTAFLQAEHIQTAWIQGLGAALDVTLGYYNLAAQRYEWRDIAGPLELTSLQGNAVTTADGLALHLHATLSDDQYRAIGGHVRQLTVGGTCELLVRPLDVPLTRQHDDQTGLSLLARHDIPPHRTV